MGIANTNVLVQLREMRDSLTPVSQKLADYVLQNPREIPSYSIKTLAKKSKTSDAAVMRFCKSMGFEGYRSFIVNLSAALGSLEESSSLMQIKDIQPGDTLESIVQTISSTNQKSIENTLSVLDIKQVEKAVGLLSHAGRMAFCGLGASGLVATDAQQKFMRINKISYAYTDGHTQLTGLSLLGPQDVAVLISNSGETLDILDCVELLTARKVPIIGITRYSKSSLAAAADVVLYISTPELKIRSGAMSSRIAMMNLVDILYAGVVSQEYDTSQKYLLETHKALETKRK